MKLLFDENLSPRLISLLLSEFAGSAHVEVVGQRAWTDQQVWEYAKQNDFIIVSKDNDFRQRAFLYGAPPKVIWLAVGNASTSVILDVLNNSVPPIRQFSESPVESLLILPR